MIEKKYSERGQVLVLLVFGIVGLLGFTALAIDGGMLYSDRRHAQNAADAASLAGGGEAAMVFENNSMTYATWSCANSVMNTAESAAQTAAIGRADDNGFVIDQDISDKHGVDIVCGEEPNYWNTWTDRYMDIHTWITAETQPAFSQFVFKGPLRNQVEAVVRIRPRRPLVFGHAIVALNPANCSGNSNGVVVGGNIAVNVNGGGIFSNGCMIGNGNSLNVNVTNGNVAYVQQLNTQHSGTFSPQPSNVSDTIPSGEFDVTAPDCSQVPNAGSPSNAYANNASGNIPPGNYTRIKANGAIVLQGGGLYCMHGNFDPGNNDVSIDSSGGIPGVTIYLINGDFVTDGGGNVSLEAPPYTPDPSPAIPGVLIYMAHGNSGIVKLRGNSGSDYYGTVYAPDGDIDAAGTTGVTPTLHTQLIGYNVIIGGTVDIDINFDAGDQYQKPTSLDLYR